MLTKEDKEMILKALKNIDVKKLELDYPDKTKVKWFRFGSFIGIDIAAQVIKNLPENTTTKKVDKSMSGTVS